MGIEKAIASYYGKKREEKPIAPIFVHPVRTTTPCAHCGKNATQLLSKSKGGAWLASCSSGQCMNAVTALARK